MILQWGYFAHLTPTYRFRDMKDMKSLAASRDWGKELTEHFSLQSVVVCFPFSFIREEHTLAFLFQVQFHQVQLHLGFPDHTSVCPYSIPVLFSGHPSLLPLSVLFLLFPLFDQQVLAQPRCFPASSDWLLMLEEAHSHTLKAPMSLKTVSRGIPSTDSLRSPKFVRPTVLKITNSTRACLLHPRHPQIITPLMMSFTLVRTKSSNAGSYLQYLYQEITSTSSRGLLDFMPYWFSQKRHLGGWNPSSGWDPASTKLFVAEARRLTPDRFKTTIDLSFPIV